MVYSGLLVYLSTCLLGGPMPVKIPTTLPARLTLEQENIFVMDEERAIHQDIRPLRVAILNLMPTKIATETQLLRLLSNSALQVEVTLLHTATYDSKNTDADHLLHHYLTFNDIRNEKFDGLIVTGAPVEQMPFEEVDYWKELSQVFDWAETNVESIFHICWGAQAGLYHRYGIPKYDLPHKMFGVFEHRVLSSAVGAVPLLRGFDDVFYAPHSRHTEIRRADIEKVAMFKSWLSRTRRVSTSLAQRTDVISSSRVTQSMIRSRSKANMTGMSTRDCQLVSPKTIIRIMTQSKLPPSDGVDMQICCTLIG